LPNYTYDLPKDYYFGGGGDTFAPPLAIVILALAGILILALPRKYAIVPFLIAVMLIPMGVTVVIASLHLQGVRLLVLVGLVRLLARGERFPGRLTVFDHAVLYSAICNAVMYSLLWREVGAIVNRFGFLLTALGAYFLLRYWVRDKADVIRMIKTFAFIFVLIAPFMWREAITDHNAFSVLGASELSDIRNGRIRAQGPFAHSIIAGTMGAVWLPLFVGLWWYQRDSRWIAAAGALASTVMMLASASSTPVMTYPAAILGLALWPARKRMQLVRWGIIGLLIALQLCMKVPVWFVLNRVSGVFGGSGWHRAMLVDNFVWHFFEWCLIGTRDNANWGWSMWDVDNAYVGAGLSGGLLNFILFIAVLVQGYRIIGVARRSAEGSRRDARLIWSIGAALFANSVAFFGIVYFDQSIVAWYALLAIIALVPKFVPAAQVAPAKPAVWDALPAEPAYAVANS
jgi:hypothetical protein